MDWLAFGLPREGKSASVRNAGELAEREVPTCSLTNSVGEVQERIRRVRWNVCVVVNDKKVVLGLLWGEGLEASATTPVEQVMDADPKTVRPNVSREEATEKAREMDGVLVTTSDGELIGLLHVEHEHEGEEHHEGAL